jgi:rubrerythrin
MSPEFAKVFVEHLEQLAEDNAPKECWPRLAYFGHKLKYTQFLEETIWVGKSGRKYPFRKEICTWECRECQHEFKGEDGIVCPSCAAVSNK